MTQRQRRAANERAQMTAPAGPRVQLDRRALIRSMAATTLAVAAHAIGSDGTASAATTLPGEFQSQGEVFWPNNARLAISLSLMFEGGGQPISGAGGVIPDRIQGGAPDLPTNAFFA